MKYLTDDQYDELFEHLQGTNETQTDGMSKFGFKGMKLTPEQIIHRKESFKRCKKCGTWMGVGEYCNCC